MRPDQGRLPREGGAILIDQALADRLPFPPGVRLRGLGPVLLRGRGTLALAAVELA